MKNKRDEVYARRVARHEKNRLPLPLKGVMIIVLIPFILVGLLGVGIVQLMKIK